MAHAEPMLDTYPRKLDTAGTRTRPEHAACGGMEVPFPVRTKALIFQGLFNGKGSLRGKKS